ncbi:MAG: hypothetical protein AAGI17_01830 [Planctomycetota bacterium]
MSAVRAAIGEDPSLAPVDSVASLLELSVRMKGRKADLVLVDVSPNPEELLDAMKEVAKEHEETRFVVIAAEFDKDHLLLAMQAGARHFMPKSWISQDMLPVCRELVEQIYEGQEEGELRLGDVITIFPASGGCGATTVATSLAAEFARVTGQDALVVDLDIRFGGVAAHLGLSAGYGIADVLERGEELDANLVASTAVGHNDGVDALLSPVTVDFEDPPALHAENLGDAISVFRRSYPATVIDAPALVPDAAAALSKFSTRVILLLELSVKDLTVARQLLGALRSRGVMTPVTVVANKTGRPADVTVEDVKEALEIEGDVIALPDDPRATLEALREGKTLKEQVKSALRQGLEDMAREMTSFKEEGEESDEKSDQPKKGLFGRRKSA